MTATGTTSGEDAAYEIYTAYEIDFMLGLRPTDAGAITREQVGLRSAPEAAEDYVTAAVTAGLRARGKVEQQADGRWQLGAEGQAIAQVLTGADRWLGLALAQGEAMRMAFIIRAADRVLLLTQDELDSFQVSAVLDPQHAPGTVATLSTAFLEGEHGRTVSLRRTDVSDPAQTVPLMMHVEADGDWKVAHLPLDENDVLTVSPIRKDQIAAVIARLWEDGVSEAPAAG